MDSAQEWLTMMDHQYLNKWFCAPDYKEEKMFKGITLAGQINFFTTAIFITAIYY
jgi:hypothetical protein